MMFSRSGEGKKVYFDDLDVGDTFAYNPGSEAKFTKMKVNEFEFVRLSDGVINKCVKKEVYPVECELVVQDG